MKRGLPDPEHTFVRSGREEMTLAYGMIRMPVDGPGEFVVNLQEISIGQLDVPVKNVTITGIKIVKQGDHLYIGPSDGPTLSDGPRAKLDIVRNADGSADVYLAEE